MPAYHDEKWPCQRVTSRVASPMPDTKVAQPESDPRVTRPMPVIKMAWIECEPSVTQPTPVTKMAWQENDPKVALPTPVRKMAWPESEPNVTRPMPVTNIIGSTSHPQRRSAKAKGVFDPFCLDLTEVSFGEKTSPSRLSSNSLAFGVVPGIIPSRGGMSFKVCCPGVARASGAFQEEKKSFFPPVEAEGPGTVRQALVGEGISRTFNDKVEGGRSFWVLEALVLVFPLPFPWEFLALSIAAEILLLQDFNITDSRVPAH
uniref:Uncharacterized protein n=1 Tax=Cannabis sativa TaxID=3483 RepID=A0A803P445_CANSA